MDQPFQYEFEWDPGKGKQNLGSENVSNERAMKEEYDFSKAIRGKFYKKGVVLRIPIYLDTELQRHLERIARKKGKDIGDLVNQWVKKEVELIDELL